MRHDHRSFEDAMAKADARRRSDLVHDHALVIAAIGLVAEARPAIPGRFIAHEAARLGECAIGGEFPTAEEVALGVIARWDAQAAAERDGRRVVVD